MGDIGSKRGWTTVLPVAALLLAACATAPAPAPASASSGSSGVVAVDEPVEIRAVELRHDSGHADTEDAVLQVSADAPLVWTSFRDPDGRLIVELPNSVAAQAVGDLTPASGLVASVQVERPDASDGPMTRLVVSTRREVEHAVAGDGRALEIRLTPVAPLPGGRVAKEETVEEPPVPAADLAYEPLPVEEEPEELTVADLEDSAAAAAGGAVHHPTAAGTAEDPFVAPPPTGAAAGVLDGVAVSLTDHGTMVRVSGDGQFAYSTFSLDDPHRFVIDLDGVINRAEHSAVPVGGMVQRVRVGQFRSQPQPVSRVVFDLDQPLVPRIERTGDALLVDFGELNGNRPAARAGSHAMPARTVPASSASSAGPGTATASNGASNGAVHAAGNGAAAPRNAPPQVPEDEEQGMPQPPVAQQPPEDEGDEMVMEGGPEGVAEPAMREPMEPAPDGEGEEPPMEEVTDLDLYAGDDGGDELEIETPDEQGDADPFGARTLDGEREYVGEVMSFSLREADLVETLRSFAVMAGLNIVIQPGVSGTVTVELNDVPWDQAFEQILKINGLSYDVEGNIMRIAPTEQLSQEAQQRRQLEAAKSLSVPLTTVIRRLSYAQAPNVAGLLAAGGGILSQRGSVLVDGRTNTLIIKELPNYIDTVIAVIENLDIPEPLVMIEARIVETRKNFTKTLGVSWGFSGVSSPATGNTTGLQFPNQGTVDGGVNLVTGGANAFVDLTLGNVLDTFNLDARLQAAENDGLVNILSAPKVQALNNEQASIQSGFQIPIQTVANNTVSVQFVNATLRLDVTPQVTAEGTVLMDINIQKRNPEFGLTVAGAQNAPISTKEARTRVIVRDGGTTVIGGIYEVTTNQGEDRVPGLANVPIIGHLFKNKRRTDENSELLIFITPRVVKL